LKANPRHPDYRRSCRNILTALIQANAGLGDRAGAKQAAETLRDLGWDPAADPYAAACALAQCVPIVEKDDTLDAAERQAEIEFYADQAMSLLREAVAKGYKNFSQLKTDKNLDPLREREDFQQVVAKRGEAKEAPPRKP
jgi:hypothetical protein